MEIKKLHLPEDEYFPSETEKKSIVLHHTAGSHRPDWVVSAWDRDKTKGGKSLKVATHFVVGGKSTRDGNDEWDGKIVESFDLKYWAHHLGTRNNNNILLNQQSIGIEICNYGPLTKSQNGEFFTYVNSKVPEEDVIDLGKNWRGFRYYHNYTDKQIESVKFLIEKCAEIYKIDPCKGINELYEPYLERVKDWSVLEQQKFLNSKGYLGMNGKPLSEDGMIGRNTNYALRLYTDAKREKWKPFDYQPLANEGGEGVWSHTNFRKDKFDVYPHPKLIEMLRSF